MDEVRAEYRGRTKRDTIVGDIVRVYEKFNIRLSYFFSLHRLISPSASTLFSSISFHEYPNTSIPISPTAIFFFSFLPAFVPLSLTYCAHSLLSIHPFPPASFPLLSRDFVNYAIGCNET